MNKLSIKSLRIVYDKDKEIYEGYAFTKEAIVFKVTWSEAHAKFMFENRFQDMASVIASFCK